MGIGLSGLCAAIIRKGLRPGPPHHSTLVHTAGEGIRPPSVRHGFALRFPRNVGRTVEPQALEQASVNQNIEPFARFISYLVNESLNGRPVAKI